MNEMERAHRRLAAATGPFQQLVGYRSYLEPDLAVRVELDIGEQHLSQYGFGHGGVTLTLLDTAGGLAVLAQAPDAARIATISLAANFVRGLEAGRAVATGRLDYLGGTVAHASMELRAEHAEGSLLATARAAYRIFRGQDAGV